MLRLRGVGCDVIGVCIAYLGLAGSWATLPQFHQGNVLFTFPQMNQDFFFSHLLFVVLTRNIPAGFVLMFLLKHLLWGLWFLMDHQYSAPWMNHAGIGSTGCGGGHMIRWSYRVLSSTLSIVPYPTPESLEYCWRLWPLVGCPMSQCPGSGHACLNQVVLSVMFFHSQIPLSPMQYGMHQFCYLQTRVGFWFPWTFLHIDPSSFPTWQC